MRPGGRVHTARLEGSAPGTGGDSDCGGGVVVGLADLGGSIVTGCDGNPLAVVALQGGVPLHAIVDRTPVYWEDGEPVDPDLDQKVSSGTQGFPAVQLMREWGWARWRAYVL